MKNALLFLFLLAAATRVNAQAPAAAAPDANAPVITFDDEMIDFGSIAEGSEQVRTFTFTNTGNAPLTITAIKGQCGCTTFDFSKDPIPPGGKGSFKVKYDSATRVGMFDKKIMVYSNASMPVVEVKIKGKVVSAGAPANGGN